MRKSLLSLVLFAGLAGPCLAPRLGAASVCAGTLVTGMTFNSALLIQLVNNPGSFNPGRAVGILTAQVSNPNTCTVVNPTYNLTVTELGNASDTCMSSPGYVVSVTGLQATKTLAPGAHVTLLASDFSKTGTPNVQLCQAFTSQLVSQFQNVDPSQAGAAVIAFLNRRFMICLRDATTSSEGCTTATVSNPPQGNVGNCATLLIPQDQSSQSNLPFFVWTPASAQGDPTGIRYQLVISQSSSGDPWYVANNIPTAQTYYKWTGSPVLAPGRYYWYVISTLKSNGKTVGGQNGDGHSLIHSFTVGDQNGNASGPCHYSLADLDAFVKANAGDKAAMLQGFALNGILPSALNDPDLCALLASPKANLVGISITKR